MLIMLEGVDCTGKSTLCTAIANYARKVGTIKKFKVVEDAENLVSTNPRKPNRITHEDLQYTLWQWINDKNTLYIMDRGPISDNVYRIFDDHEVIMDLWDIKYMFDTLNGIVVVHTRSPRGEQIVKERGDDNPIALQRYKDIWRAYERIMPIFAPDLYQYDFDFHDMHKFAKTIVDRVLKERRYLHENRKKRQVPMLLRDEVQKVLY